MKREGFKYTCAPRSGYTQLVSPKNATLRWIEFGTIKLARGESIDLPVGKREVVLALIRGRCIVEADGRKMNLGPRRNIFEEQPFAIYARGFDALRVASRSGLEALVSAAPASSRKSPDIRLVEPPDVVERTVGTGTYERRVRTIIGEDFPAERLLVGETLNEAGKWSSYPPHRHEQDSPPREAKLEEVYYYKLEKPSAFGIQRIYTDDRRIDETHAVRDGDLCVLPRGYHPVAAVPGSRLYYFWALAGNSRKMRWRVDPDFARG